jgi:hypothetical protein
MAKTATYTGDFRSARVGDKRFPQGQAVTVTDNQLRAVKAAAQADDSLTFDYGSTEDKKDD